MLRCRTANALLVELLRYSIVPTRYSKEIHEQLLSLRHLLYISKKVGFRIS
jgi:hypothetical protein